MARGYTDRRSARSNAPSVGALADEIGVNTTTITEAITGKRRPNIETVRLLAEKLGADVPERLGVPIREPYEPPAEADLLTPRQRKAVTELIRAFVSDEQEGGGEHGDGSPATKPPAPGPADQPGLELLTEAARRNPKRPRQGPREQGAD